MCAFPHWKGCLKIENSRLARVNLILLLVWTIHTAIIEGKHLKVQKKVTVKFNVWQDKNGDSSYGLFSSKGIYGREADDWFIVGLFYLH